MSEQPTPYVIRRGDYLTLLAHRAGRSAEEVWQLPENAGLRSTRVNYDRLAPGDVVYLPSTEAPGLPLTAQADNRYVVTIPRVRVDVVFKHEGKPLANESVLLHGLPGAPTTQGKTDSDGRLRVEVPLHVREIDVVFHNRGHLRYGIKVGDLDPADTTTGVRSRLKHLGFYGWSAADVAPPGVSAEDRDRQALLAFQRSVGIPETAVADAATLEALNRIHLT